MYKLLLLLPFFSTSSTGIWVMNDGSAVEVPCPDIVEYDERVRLPAGCEVALPGVWLSTSRYKEMELEQASITAELAGKNEIISALKERVAALEINAVITSAIPECPPPKECVSFLGGALIGTALTTGGCIAWTLSR